MGGSFEDIADIMDSLDTDRVGVCLDTCHLFVSGYELRTPEGLNRTIDAFNSRIGLQKLKLVHLNDSIGGLGAIGEEGFRTILGCEEIRDLPFILETPVDSRRDDRQNLEVARKLASHPELQKESC